MRYDGLFVSAPLQYVDGEMRELTDINFDGMSVKKFVEILKRFIPANHSFRRLYYSKNDTTLALGIREIKSDEDVGAMLNAGYENGNLIDLYVEHYDYDVLEYIKQSEVDEQIIDNDEYYSSDECEDIEGVDFQSVGDENVVIKDFSTPDTFLNRLCSNRVTFKKAQVPENGEVPQEDPDGDSIDPAYKVKKGMVYPAFDPELPWDKMEPVLGMRYESAYQLKLALTNYGVAHGYQLWFMKNDWRELLVFCGRNVAEGKCAGKKGQKDKVMPKKDMAAEVAKKIQTQAIIDSGEGSSKQTRAKGNKIKKVLTKKLIKHTGEGSSQGRSSCQSPKRKKKNISKGNYVPCTFRLYASWMSNEHSFQIKSLIQDHKCSRNYNLGSLVNFKWIAAQYMREIIADPFMPYRKMKEDIRQKYHIDVSLGQCRRAKQRALFEHEGGLIEHYNKLYQYKQAILESNPGSTCVVDVDGSSHFKRMYVCFKGVKDGWLAGCRKVIGLDGCFLKHTCKGELLTAMGRDANNQMYPIAWAVVRVENSINWSWFISLLKDDLCLNDGTGITIISDSHKVLCYYFHKFH